MVPVELEKEKGEKMNIYGGSLCVKQHSKCFTHNLIYEIDLGKYERESICLNY